MKVNYDPESDSLTIVFKDSRIKESDEVRDGVIVDFDYNDTVVRIEILNASSVVHNTREILFAVGAS